MLRWRFYREHKFVLAMTSNLEQLIARCDFTRHEQVEAVAEIRQLDTLVIKIVADLMECHTSFAFTPDLFMKEMRFAGNPEFVAELDRCGGVLRAVKSKLLVNRSESFADNLNRFNKILLDIKKIADDFDKTFGMKMRVSEEFIPKLVRLIESISTPGLSPS